MTGTLSPAQGVPVDDEVIFSDYKGTRKPRVEKRQRNLLSRLEFLHGVLADDERVLLVTHALSPTPLLEQMTTGLVFIYIKRCLLVFTNKRILHLPTTIGYKYRQSIAEISWADTKSMRMKGATLKFQLANGEHENFLYVARRERRKIKSLIDQLPLTRGTPTGTGRVHLCPRCQTRQVAGTYDCPQCRLAFKSKPTATRLSLLLPGGGYFYTGHYLLGISDALVELLLLGALALSLMDWVNGNAESVAAVIIFGVFIAIEKTVTIYHARHFVDEYIPKERQIQSLESAG